MCTWIFLPFNFDPLCLLHNIYFQLLVLDRFFCLPNQDQDIFWWTKNQVSVHSICQQLKWNASRVWQWYILWLYHKRQKILSGRQFYRVSYWVVVFRLWRASKRFKILISPYTNTILIYPQIINQSTFCGYFLVIHKEANKAIVNKPIMKLLMDAFAIWKQKTKCCMTYQIERFECDMFTVVLYLGFYLYVIYDHFLLKNP